SCTNIVSSLCRLIPVELKSIAGTVGMAPSVYSPVESVPSPALLNRSNFTATLGEICWYPRPLPKSPSAAVPWFWIANVIPFAEGLDNWKAKVVLNDCTFTGVYTRPNFPHWSHRQSTVSGCHPDRYYR